MKLKKLYMVIEMNLAEQLEQLGFKKTDSKILGYLVENPGYKSTSELAEIVEVTKPTISARTKVMVEQGLLNVSQSPVRHIRGPPQNTFAVAPEFAADCRF